MRSVKWLLCILSLVASTLYRLVSLIPAGDLLWAGVSTKYSDRSQILTYTDYVFQWAIVLPLELVVAGFTVGYWNDEINVGKLSCLNRRCFDPSVANHSV